MSNVLLIEDDAAIRTSLTRGLRDRGHAVSSAPAALDGLRLAVEERPTWSSWTSACPTWTAWTCCGCSAR